MSVAAGSRLGPYLLGERVGLAGSGEWFVASEAGLERPVSLVVTALPGDEAALVALRERARRLVAVSDARLLPVYGQGEDEQVLWLATRQIVGLPFPQLGRLDERRAARLGVQLAGQLAVLQDAGIAPTVLTGDDLLVEGEGEKERAWLLPDPLRPVTDDASGATRSLAELLETQAGRPLLSETPSDPQTLAELLAPKAGRPDQRRKLIVAAAAAAVAAVAAIGLTLALTNNDTNTSKQAAANTPIARVTARIPLGAEVSSLAADSKRVWISTAGGALLHVDPSTNRVVGAPLPARAGIDLALQGDVLWSASGELVRANAANGRILGRRKGFGIGFVTSLLVTKGAVWGTVVEPPNLVGRAVKFDATTLKELGRTEPLGGFPVLVTEADNSVWAAALNDGSLARATGREPVSTIVFGVQGRYPARTNGRLWIPTGVDRTIVAVDPRRMAIQGVVRLPASPIMVAAGAGSIWVLTENPSRIYRVDPVTSQVLGSPITAPKGARVLRLGAGSLWVDDPKAKALVRLSPTIPAPAPRPPAPSGTSLQNGPIPVGERLRVNTFRPPFSIAAPDQGWLAGGLQVDGLTIMGIRDPVGVGLSVDTPTRVFDSSARLVSVRSANDFLRILRSNPQLRISGVTPVTLGGLKGLRARVEAHPKKTHPVVCGGTPCVPLFPVPNGGTGILTKGVTEFTFVKRSPGIFIVQAGFGDRIDPAIARRVNRLVASIRFEK